MAKRLPTDGSWPPPWDRWAAAQLDELLDGCPGGVSLALHVGDRQVWDRQRTSRDTGRVTHRSAGAGEWVVSVSVAHQALVSESLFVAAQQVRAARPTGVGGRRTYLLAGLVQCALYGRRLDSHWVHDRAGYRCRHGRNSAVPPTPDRAKGIYVREDVLIDQLAEQLEPGGNLTDAAAVTSMVMSLRAADVMIVHDGYGVDLERYRCL